MHDEKVAILGYTGFVGSYLREAYPHAALYNSCNLDKLASDVQCEDDDICFDLVFCACVPAVKWMAQAHPEKDEEVIKRIQERIACLRGRCRRFVLVSTIDVHNHSMEGQREDTVMLDTTSHEPYGRHRYAMEQWCLQNIVASETTVTIVRLPALFGIGLKKNIVYDMLHNQRLDAIQANSVFQWYDLGWLVDDIRWTIKNNIPVAHFYSEPIYTSKMIAHVFPEHLESVSASAASVPKYRHQTLYPERFARSSTCVLEALSRFVSVWRMIHGTFWGRHIACTNLAWDSPKDDEHALFVLNRYGIHHVELALTRYSQGSWKAFQNEEPAGLLEKIRERYASAGMQIVSLQSLLYGVVPKGGTLKSHKEEIVDHVKKVIGYAKALGVKVLVFGSPTLRVAPATEDDLCEVFERVREAAREAGVCLCLEPNAHGYGCTIGCCIQDVQSLLESRFGTTASKKNEGIGITFDTGNAWMEIDAATNIFAASSWIRHMQISVPYLKTGEEAHDLERILQAYGDILMELGKEGQHYISIEAQCSSNRLAGHIRRVTEAFAGIYETYGASRSVSRMAV